MIDSGWSGRRRVRTWRSTSGRIPVAERAASKSTWTARTPRIVPASEIAAAAGCDRRQRRPVGIDANHSHQTGSGCVSQGIEAWLHGHGSIPQ